MAYLDKAGEYWRVVRSLIKPCISYIDAKSSKKAEYNAFEDVFPKMMVKKGNAELETDVVCPLHRHILVRLPGRKTGVSCYTVCAKGKNTIEQGRLLAGQLVDEADRS